MMLHRLSRMLLDQAFHNRFRPPKEWTNHPPKCSRAADSSPAKLESGEQDYVKQQFLGRALVRRNTGQQTQGNSEARAGLPLECGGQTQRCAPD
jgi:hypothetical protein